MKSSFLLTALVVAFCFASAALAEKKTLKPEQDWTGYIKADPAKDTPTGAITDQVKWEKLWTAWRKGEAPKVDFTKSLVVAITAGGPNSWVEKTIQLDDKGDLFVNGAATEKGGPGFIYWIVVVKKEGVKTVNRKKVE